MNKKLIAAAIAAVVAAPAAVAADTTLYGKAHVFVASNDDGSRDNYTAESTNSRLGVKGSEDLGGGLKAIFKYETTVNITDGGSAGGTFGSARNAYVGLSGGFGTVLVGRHDTPAKVAFYAAGTDHLDGSIVDMNDNGFYERRVDNAIAYISPNFSGFTAAVAIVPGEGGTTNNPPAATDNPADGLTDAYSLGLMYAGGGLKASVGYEVLTGDLNDALNSTVTGLDDEKTWQLGASYTFSDFTVGGNYQSTSDKGGVSGTDMSIWALSAKAAFGNNYVLAEYGNNDTDGSPDVSTFGLALGHKFSKRTQVYAAYKNTDDGPSDGDRFALGMIHTF